MKRNIDYSDCPQHQQPSTSAAWKNRERNGPNGTSAHQSDHPADCQSPTSSTAKFHTGGTGLKPTWKLLLPLPNEGDVKTRLFRVAGICKEKPEHNVHSIRDPRKNNWHRAIQHGPDHLIPTNFIVDEDYAAVPTKREVAITGLNDNADERFIRGLFKCGNAPLEVVVYYHPTTKRHLRMAHVDFKSFKEASEFITKHDGKPMMGSVVHCFFDPLCYQLSQLYQRETNQVPPMPQRYSSLKSTRAIQRLRELCRRLYDTDSPQPVPFANDIAANRTPGNPLRQQDTIRHHSSSTIPHTANGCAKAGREGVSPRKMQPSSATPNYTSILNGHRAQREKKIAGAVEEKIGCESRVLGAATNDCEIVCERKLGRMAGSVGKEHPPIKASPSSKLSVPCIELPPSPPCVLLASPPPPPLPPNFAEFALSPATSTPGTLPPPGLINPPRPVGLEPGGATPGLERRLAMIFGAKREPTTPVQASQVPQSQGSTSAVETNSGVDRVKSSSHRHGTRHRAQWGERELTKDDRRDVEAWPNAHPSLSPSRDAHLDGMKSEDTLRNELAIAYNDVRCRVRNMIATDLKAMLHRDLLKHLEVKALNALDDRYQASSSNSKSKGEDLRRAVKREPENIRGASPRMECETPAWKNSISDSRDHLSDPTDELNFKSLFGFCSHRERMAYLPSFKKKPVDQRRMNKRVHTNRRLGASSHSPTPDDCIYLEDEDEEPATRRSLESVSSLNASRVSSEEAESGSDQDGEDSEQLWTTPNGISRRRTERSDSVVSTVQTDELPISLLPKIPRLSKGDSEERFSTDIGSESPLHSTTPAPEPMRWPVRSEEELMRIVHLVESEEISKEDAGYLDASCSRDTTLPMSRRGLMPTSISRPTPLELESPVKKGGCEYHYDDPQLAGIVPHKSGCARTEGYYRISKQRKRMVRRHEDFNGRTVISEEDLTAIRCQQMASKEERSTLRRLTAAIGADSILLKVNQLKYRKKMLKFSRSRIHGWGLYALEQIQPEAMIIEYVGEVVRPTVADERERKYEKRGMGSSYMFRIDDAAVIDATVKGNFGRFINHSCAPNCTARVVTVEGDKRIVIYSKRLIEKGEEITYDYKFAREDEASKIECLCGARSCQKFLN